MLLETKSEPDLKKGPFLKKPKNMGPNGVHGEPKKCPREPKKDPGGASAAPKGASKGSRGSPRGVPGTPNGALGRLRAGIFTGFGKVGEFFDAKNAKKKMAVILFT